MTPIEEILKDLDALTDEAVEQCIGSLAPPDDGDEALGVIQSTNARRMWTLAFEYARKAELTRHSYRFDAKSDDERKLLAALYHRLEQLEEAARDLAWIEIHDEIGATAWNTHSVGMAKGFIACKTSLTRPNITIGSPFELQALSEVAGKVLRRLQGHTEESEPDPPKGKPQ